MCSQVILCDVVTTMLVLWLLFQEAVDKQDLVSLLKAALLKLKLVAGKYTSKSALGKNVSVSMHVHWAVLQMRLYARLECRFTRD